MSLSNLCFYLNLMTVLVFCRQNKTLEEICESVRVRDEYLCELLRKPKLFNRNRILPGIQAYIQSFSELEDQLNVNSNKTLEECEDIFEEQGANFMHIRYDRDDLINLFQWNEIDLDEYDKWRGKTLDAWLNCEKYIYKHVFD